MTPATGNPRKFHKGPPPHVGWWLADTHETLIYWRWWNGKCWSVGVQQHADLDEVDHWASIRAMIFEELILWSDYWPANARVPRINPNKEAA